MKKITVKDLGEVITGHTPPTSKREYYGDYYPFLKPTDMIIGSKYTYFTEEGYSELAYNKYKNSLIPKGATCVVCIGTLGEKMCMAHCDLFTNQSVNSIIPNEKFEEHYVFYLLKYNLHRVKALNKGTASGREFVSKTTFLDLEIDVHEDFQIQKKIGELLSAYDNLIENNQKQIKLLEEAAQRLYKEWFVDLRFPGYEETEIIDGIPNGWAKKSILENDIFIFSKNKVCPFDGEKQYYATADITGTTISSDGATITYMNKPSRASVQPVNNSVWFARMSNTYKILNCFGESSHLANDSVISSGFAGFTALEGCFGFVYATIASKRFDDEKNRYATGATQVSLTNEGLKKIGILIPTIDIVQQYSRMVEPYLEKAELLKRNCKLLQQARDRLLPKLMSGEIEV